jgi:hypothetical protein
MRRRLNRASNWLIFLDRDGDGQILSIITLTAADGESRIQIKPDP